MARLRDARAGASWIRGNGERWTADPDAAPDNAVVPGAIAAAREALGADVVADLASLPVRLPARRHAGLPRLAAQRRALVRSGAEPAMTRPSCSTGVDAPRVLFGHTHLPFPGRRRRRSSSSTRARSGMPFDGDPRAAYALLADDGTIEHRRVGYDHAASAERVRGLGGEWAEMVARRIEQRRDRCLSL